MSNYEIKVQIDISKTEKEATQGTFQGADGSFKRVISRAVGQSIDQCEQALLATHYPAIRETLSRHLSELSQEEAGHCGVGVIKKTSKPILSMEK